MIYSNNSWDRLHSVVVGRELNLTKRIADFTFKHFYQENIEQSVYDKLESNGNEYTIKHEYLEIRNQQLDDFSKCLESYGVRVVRPDFIKKIIPFKTPSFKSELSSASNVRDTNIIIGDAIVETPTYVQNRYFENLSLYDAFAQEYKQGGRWMRAPHTNIIEEKMDLEHWSIDRDFDKDLSNYVMAIDGAQFLRLGDDIICNVSNYNHYLGYKWVKSLFPEKNFYRIKITDNHIDGNLMAIREGTFLVNTNNYTNFSLEEIRNKMPKKYRDWEYLEPKFNSKRDQWGKTNIDLQLASSRGMDINVLSLDDKNIFVLDDAYDVIELLDKNGFNPIPIKLDNCEIFGGGLHCSTLDILRK